MKKLYLLTILSLISFNLIACGNKHSFMSLVSGQQPEEETVAINNTQESENYLSNGYTEDGIASQWENGKPYNINGPIEIGEEAVYVENENCDEYISEDSIEFEKGSDIFEITNVNTKYLELEEDILPILLVDIYSEDLEGDYTIYAPFTSGLKDGDNAIFSYKLGYSDYLEKNIISDITFIKKIEKPEIEDEDKVEIATDSQDEEVKETADKEPTLEEVLEIDREYSKEELEEIFMNSEDADIRIGVNTMGNARGLVRFGSLEEGTTYIYKNYTGKTYIFEIKEEE